MNIKYFIKLLSKVELNELWDCISNDPYFESLILSKSESFKNITIEDFFIKYEKDFSPRLKIGLINFIGLSHMRKPEAFIRLADVTHEQLKTIRNFGQKSLNEFIELRGY